MGRPSRFMAPAAKSSGVFRVKEQERRSNAQYGWYHGFIRPITGMGKSVFIHPNILKFFIDRSAETMQWTGLNELREKYLAYFEQLLQS